MPAVESHMTKPQYYPYLHVRVYTFVDSIACVGWLFFFYITEQTGNSAQYYDGGVTACPKLQVEPQKLNPFQYYN